MVSPDLLLSNRNCKASASNVSTRSEHLGVRSSLDHDGLGRADGSIAPLRDGTCLLTESEMKNYRRPIDRLGREKKMVGLQSDRWA